MIISKPKVGAIVVAAGASLRMGQPKLVLPWGDSTVIGRVIHVLEQAYLDEIIVVTGGTRALIENVLDSNRIRTIYNPAYGEGDMLSSVQVGLKSLESETEAALITLGDQPFIQLDVVRLILSAYRSDGDHIVVPSYHMMRGHPWLVAKTLWNDIMNLNCGETLRDFINSNRKIIKYIDVNTDSVLLDLDTMEDYNKYRPLDSN